MEQELVIEPETAGEIYWNIIQVTDGVLLFFLIVFLIGLYLIAKKGKSKKFKISYSALYIGAIAFLYSDSFLGVSEFLRLCETYGGFHGEPIPSGSGVMVVENLGLGCGGLCSMALIKGGNVSYVEGRAWDGGLGFTNKALSGKSGLYRVQIISGDDPYCDPYFKHTASEKQIESFGLPEKYCYKFTPIDSYSASFLVKTEFSRSFAKSKNIYGEVTRLYTVADNSVYSSTGNLRYILGTISIFDVPMWGMSNTLSVCANYSPYSPMWGGK